MDLVDRPSRSTGQWLNSENGTRWWFDSGSLCLDFGYASFINPADLAEIIQELEPKRRIAGIEFQFDHAARSLPHRPRFFRTGVVGHDPPFDNSTIVRVSQSRVGASSRRPSLNAGCSRARGAAAPGGGRTRAVKSSRARGPRRVAGR